jgi:4-hydroxy-3-polyprenylbenzoate decarboxylase
LSPAFYLKPQSVAEIVEHMAQRAIGLLGVDDLAAPSPEWSNDTPPTCPRH